MWKLGSYTVNDSNNAVIKNNLHRKDIKQVNNIEEDSALDKLEITNNNIQTQTLKITENPMKLVSVQTKGKKQIKSCELSPSGEFIVYSTDSHVRMLKLETVSIFAPYYYYMRGMKANMLQSIIGNFLCKYTKL